MIGTDSVTADVEAGLVALKALSDAGIENLSIDLTVPTLLGHIFDAESCGDEERDLLSGLAEKRDRDALDGLTSKAAKTIVLLLDLNGGIPQTTDMLKQLALPEKAAGDMQRLMAVATELRQALDIYGLAAGITTDPLERRGFDYQTGVSFTLFARGARGELGRGGRYEIRGSGAPETATGFTLYMDTILRVAPALPLNPRRIVADSASWADVRALQTEGIETVRSGT
jgi:ATP phosphoribosyltransferase regulatory subunit